jgi:hypothetical protein
MVIVSERNYSSYGMIRQYKVLNGKLEPVGPAFYGDSTFYDLTAVAISSDGKRVATGTNTKWKSQSLPIKRRPANHYRTHL